MQNAIPFSGRVTVETGAAETLVQPLAVPGDGTNRSPVLTYVSLEPATANVTSIEIGFIEPITSSFMPRCESTSTLGRREYTGMLQTGPRGGKLAVRIVTGAASSAKILYDGMFVDG